MKRRTFLAESGAALGLLMIGCQSVDSTQTDLPGDPDTDTDTDTGPPPEFHRPLVIPPLLESTTVDGRRVFELEAMESQHTFFEGQPAHTYGYNGSLLGPTIRARRGEDLTIRVTNSLQEVFTTHWHGAHLPAAADGGPHQRIEPGSTWVSEWTVNQVACTNWYHPHTEGKTAFQVYMGLAGLFIIDDDHIDTLDLPTRYGVDDIPIVLQDRRFNDDGSLQYVLSMQDQMRGFQGDTFIVNGVIKPFVSVEAKQVRFRILNGSNACFCELSFTDSTMFQIIGVDNSLLEAPVSLTEIQMGPGERVEIVVDLTDRLGDTLRLREAGTGLEVMEVRVDDEPAVVTVVPDQLIELDHIDVSAAVRTRTFELAVGMGAQFSINGEQMNPDVINEEVVLDEVEIWEITATAPGMMANMAHDFHMHAHHFEVLTRDGEPVGPEEGGYKDTVRIASGEVVRVAVQHRDYADPDAPYMYHCHILEHEDQGMMGQFVVVAAV